MSMLIDTPTSWTKFEKQKLSLKQCFGIIQDFWKEISLAQDSLLSIYAGLNDGEEIDSDQCSNLIGSIQKLKEPVQSFYRFLENIIHLQVRSRMKRPVTSRGKTSMLTSLTRANCMTSA